MNFHTCINCRQPVLVMSAAAWPERCPHCYATPFATSSLNIKADVSKAVGRPMFIGNQSTGAIPG